MDALERSHQAATIIQKSLLWLAGSVQAWCEEDDAFRRNNSVMMFQGLRETVGIFRENCNIYDECLKAVDGEWIKASPSAVRACGATGRSAHHLAYVLALDVLETISLVTSLNFSTKKQMSEASQEDPQLVWSEAASPDDIAFESLPEIAKALNFLDYDGVNTIGEYLRREEIYVSKSKNTTYPQIDLSLNKKKAEDIKWKLLGDGRNFKKLSKDTGKKVIYRNDSRDKWIYEEAIKGRAWDSIMRGINKKSKKWEPIGIEGVRRAAARYQKRNNLPPIPARKAGRKPKTC